jgi:signal transduction histidine kinase
MVFRSGAPLNARRRIRATTGRRHRLLWELGERVKELTLLHRATHLLQEEKDLETVLRELVALLPAGWQFPEIAEARITAGDLTVTTPGFRVTAWIQRAEFPVRQGQSGVLEIAYHSAPPAAANATFLPEETNLIGSLASLLASHFERTRRAEERLELTRAQASQREAEAANRLKDAFLATVSHELRRPLTAIVGWTRMVREGVADTARGLDVIERNANIQLRLIEELLDLSRAATGQLGVRLSLVNLNAILQNVQDAATPTASKRKVEVVISLPSEEATIRGDGMRLQQVFGNLVGNAIKFTPPGGRVTITLGHAERHIQVDIADTGIGIDSASLLTIFAPFWQANPSNDGSQEGLGLGLAIVRRLVQLHGGTIEAHSAGHGHGTRMIVRLPIGADHSDGAAGPASGAPEVSDFKTSSTVSH